MAKLGFSWETADVITFAGSKDLAHAMQRLVAQPGFERDSVSAQARVERPTCEIRTFVVNGVPGHQLFTRFDTPMDVQDGGTGKFEEFSGWVARRPLRRGSTRTKRRYAQPKRAPSGSRGGSSCSSAASVRRSRQCSGWTVS